jgi:DNA-binding transcriptional regulator YhcF (GntR family)
MRLNLQHGGPVPLYHQIAEGLRHRIATGALAPGAQLPPVRAAAGLWGVNLHTVRHAYQVLRRDGLIGSHGRGGTRILHVPRAREPKGALSTFLRRVIEEGRDRHGLTPSDLAGLLASWSGSRVTPRSTVHVVECSETQCQSHCRELEGAWDVAARPWLLGPEEPPPGPVVATYFHYNDIRRLWPSRLPEVAFIAIRPDPSLRSRLARRSTSARRRDLPLCELDGEKARNIAADLLPLLPAERFRVVPHVVRRPGELLEAGGSGPILFAPRLWGALRPEQRADPRAVEVRYVMPPEEIAALGDRFGWRRQAAEAS